MTTHNGTHRLEKLFEAPPPHSLELEMALLGALLIDPAGVGEVTAIVRADDFYAEAHAALFAAIAKSSEREGNAMLIAVHDDLKRSGQLEWLGGSEYLGRLVAETPGPAGLLYYARTIAGYGRLRKLINVGGAIMHKAINSDEPPQDQIDAAEAAIYAIGDTAGELNQAEPLAVIIDREIARMESGVGPSGLATHYADLDTVTAGLQPGDMIVIAARPSMGKSALMLNIAEQMALGGPPNSPRSGQRRKVGLFTMEMSKASIAQRMLSALSGVACSAMRSGAVSDTAMQHITDAAVDLTAQVYVDDSTALSIGAVRSRARRMVQKWGVEVLFIDYMQLMTAPGSSKENRQVEVSAISRGIKALARELNIPVVVLSQLNRAAESRGGNRPRLSDLRESGAIEQDADVVMLLHREDYYNIGEKDQNGQPYQPNNEAELIVAKQRNGPTEVVKLHWNATATRFQNAARW